MKKRTRLRIMSSLFIIKSVSFKIRHFGFAHHATSSSLHEIYLHKDLDKLRFPSKSAIFGYGEMVEVHFLRLLFLRFPVCVSGGWGD